MRTNYFKSISDVNHPEFVHQRFLLNAIFKEKVVLNLEDTFSLVYLEDAFLVTRSRRDSRMFPQDNFLEVNLNHIDRSLTQDKIIPKGNIVGYFISQNRSREEITESISSIFLEVLQSNGFFDLEAFGLLLNNKKFLTVETRKIINDRGDQCIVGVFACILFATPEQIASQINTKHTYTSLFSEEPSADQVSEICNSILKKAKEMFPTT